MKRLIHKVRSFEIVAPYTGCRPFLIASRSTPKCARWYGTTVPTSTQPLCTAGPHMSTKCGGWQISNNYIDALSTDAPNWGVMDDAISARPSAAQGGGSLGGQRLPYFMQPGSLFLWPDPQRLHLPIKITPLQPQQLRRPRHIAVGLFQLLQNILALHGFADFR